jgi:hypothetical protein
MSAQLAATGVRHQYTRIWPLRIKNAISCMIPGWCR